MNKFRHTTYIVKNLRLNEYCLVNKFTGLPLSDHERDGEAMPMIYSTYAEAKEDCDELNLVLNRNK